MKPIEEVRKHRPEGTSRMAQSLCVTFVNEGHICNAEITNLSLKGALLLIQKDDPIRSTLHIGKEIHFDVLTPYGCSRCKAEIKWIDVESDPSSVGVEFTNISEDPMDPLRCAIDSPF